MKHLANHAKNLIYSVQIDGSVDSNAFRLNFEEKKYRQADLTNLIRDSIPNFALTPSEIKTFTKTNDIGLMVQEAWSRISKAPANKKGDYGEILLFILLNFFYDKPKFSTKVRLKSSMKDQVKGFDCAHFMINGEDVELWLGEAKIHRTFSSALSDTIETLNNHLKTSYLKDEFAILRSNIDSTTDKKSKEKIEALLRSGKSIHEYNIVIPILLSYEWTKIQELGKKEEKEMVAQFEAHFKEKFDTVVEKRKSVKTKFKLLFICLPLENLDDFRNSLESIEKANR